MNPHTWSKCHRFCPDHIAERDVLWSVKSGISEDEGLNVLNASKRKVKTFAATLRESHQNSVYIGYILKSEINSCLKQKAQEKTSKWGSITLWWFGGGSQFWVSVYVSGHSRICVAVYAVFGFSVFNGGLSTVAVLSFIVNVECINYSFPILEAGISYMIQF